MYQQSWHSNDQRYTKRIESCTAGFHKATALAAPNAILPEHLLQSAVFGVLLHPIEMKVCRIDTFSILTYKVPNFCLSNFHVNIAKFCSLGGDQLDLIELCDAKKPRLCEAA